MLSDNFFAQTEDLKEIALKISKLPKINEKRPRTVVITHGKEPTLVAKGRYRVAPFLKIFHFVLTSVCFRNL